MGHDENNDTSQIVNALVGILRQYRFSEDDTTKMKVGLLHVATSNTIPALLWFAFYVLSRRDMVTELREQIGSTLHKVSPNGKGFGIDALEFEGNCPLLIRCYKETLRLSVHAVHFRRVLVDTTISDGKANT